MHIVFMFSVPNPKLVMLGHSCGGRQLWRETVLAPDHSDGGSRQKGQGWDGRAWEPMEASSRRMVKGFLGQKKTPELRPQRVKQGEPHAKVWEHGGQDTEEME